MQIVNDIKDIIEGLNNCDRVSSYDVTFNDKEGTATLNVYLIENDNNNQESELIKRLYTLYMKHKGSWILNRLSYYLNIKYDENREETLLNDIKAAVKNSSEKQLKQIKQVCGIYEEIEED